MPLARRRVTFEPSWSAVPALVAGLVRPGDLVLTVGAGDVTMLGPEILAALDDARDQLDRRRAAERRRRRAGSCRRSAGSRPGAGPAGSCSALAVLGLAALVAAGWLVASSSLVELRTVTVEGTSRLTAAEVVAAARRHPRRVRWSGSTRTRCARRVAQLPAGGAGGRQPALAARAA